MYFRSIYSSTSPTNTKVVCSISGGHHSSNSTPIANTSATTNTSTLAIQLLLQVLLSKIISNKADLHSYVKEHLGGFYF